MTTKMVGIGQMIMSKDPSDIIMAPNLGSCVAVSVFEPKNKIGALIHCLLPLSKSDPAKAAANPYLYVDTGVTKMLQELLANGTDKKELRIVAAGGANINDDNNIFEIGKKNFTVLKKVLWKNSLLLKAEDFGESHSRTLSLEVASGRSFLKAQGKTIEF